MGNISPCCSETIDYSELVPVGGIAEKSEESLWVTCERDLKNEESKRNAKTILKGIDEYKGCQALARAAMQNPSDENRLAAFKGLLPVVDLINDFAQYSETIARCYSMLLENLSQKVPPGKRFAQLSSRPGLTNQLTGILDFALKFDQIRVTRFHVSNDFSYYKRLLNKFKETHGELIKYDGEREEAKLGKFIQSSTPMTLALTKASEKVKETYPCCVYVLSTIANAYLAKLGEKDSSDHEDLLRAMTLAVVLFDWVDGDPNDRDRPRGVFIKTSPIKIKSIIKYLKSPSIPNEYLDTLQYGTKTFQIAPGNIQVLFN